MPDRGTPGPSWSDKRLIDLCLAGNDEAWSALVDKYKNLVYNFLLKYRMPPEDAADIFQQVWIEVYNDLDKVRKKDDLKPWLISTTLHQAYHWKKKKKRQEFIEADEVEVSGEMEEPAIEDPDLVEEAERDQMVREAIFDLSPRCQEMIRLLFFTSPPLPYKEVAEQLGLATGSIGFIRGRCLERLRKNLAEQGR